MIMKIAKQHLLPQLVWNIMLKAYDMNKELCRNINENLFKKEFM